LGKRAIGSCWAKGPAVFGLRPLGRGRLRRPWGQWGLGMIMDGWLDVSMDGWMDG